MELSFSESAPADVEAGALAFFLSEPAALTEASAELDRRLNGLLSTLAAKGSLSAEAGKTTLVHSGGALAAEMVLAAGVGAAEHVGPDTLRTAAANTVAQAIEAGARTLAWLLEPESLALPAADQVRAVVEGVELGSYDPGRWKSSQEEPETIERLVLCGSTAPELSEAGRQASLVTAWTTRCRNLVNAPPNELTPERLAAVAQTVAGEHGLDYEELGPAEIEAEGMGGLAAVAKGSDLPPRLIALRYEPKRPAQPELVLGLVGKAITFDSGGISIKPAAQMDAMKGDMAGGAAVICGLAALAELAVPIRAVAVVAACENKPGSSAYRPGDIIRTASGKTVEITNTDAEGRVVLADALWYARRLGVTHMLDLATLTGGVVVALGDYYAGLLGNDSDWIEIIERAAQASGDYAWQLPLHESYLRYLRSTYADLKNSSEQRSASAIVGAAFLQEFAGEGPWAHLDIAGASFLSRSRADYLLARGATGYGVRLIAELGRRLAG